MVVRGISYMNKKFCFVLFMVVLFLGIFLPISQVYNLVSLIVFFLSLLIIMSWNYYMNYCNSIVPNFLINLNRNYEYIILGNINNENENNSLILKNYKRNLYTDILIMERFYSLLKPGGTCIFYIKNDKNYILCNKISPFDFCFLHPVTIYEHSKRIFTYVFQFKEIFSGIPFLLSKFTSSFSSRIDEEDLIQLENMLLEINNFSIKRNFRIILRLNDFPNDYVLEMNNKLKNKNIELEVL